MRKCSILCLTAACMLAPAAQAASVGDVVEPAMVMKLDFGGTQRSDFTMGLRLNYATHLRQTMSALAATPETALEAAELRMGSNLMTGPALTQFDFNRTGFHKASLMGRTLVTKRMRLNQNEEGEEEGMDGEAPSEDAAWYDYEEWGWMGWSLAAAGAAGVYFLVEDDDDEPTQQGGEEPPDDEPLVGCDPTGLIGECL